MITTCISAYNLNYVKTIYEAQARVKKELDVEITVEDLKHIFQIARETAIQVTEELGGVLVYDPAVSNENDGFYLKKCDGIAQYKLFNGCLIV